MNRRRKASGILLKPEGIIKSFIPGKDILRKLETKWADNTKIIEIVQFCNSSRYLQLFNEAFTVPHKIICTQIIR